MPFVVGETFGVFVMLTRPFVVLCRVRPHGRRHGSKPACVTRSEDGGLMVFNPLNPSKNGHPRVQIWSPKPSGAGRRLGATWRSGPSC